MTIKVIVSPEEKARIKELAAGGSMSSYVKRRALDLTEPDPTPIMQIIETQATVANRMNEIATNVITDKAIYEAEVIELLDRMTALENITADALKEATHNGNAGQQERQGDA